MISYSTKNAIIYHLCQSSLYIYIYRVVRQIYGNAHFDLVLEKKTKKIENLLQQLIAK